jgi:Arc/MetJ-type ribon-helix-helix transcriptional regulator
MKVELPPNLAEYIEREVAKGTFPTAAAAVAEAVSEYRVSRIDPNEDSPELEALLLEAIDSPMTPYSFSDLEEIRQRVLARRGEACR